MWDEIRMQHLADNIRQDLDLLKGFEDHLRYATDPRIIAKYQRDIERQRESLARSQQEYDEVVKIVKSVQDVVFSTSFIGQPSDDNLKP